MYLYDLVQIMADYDLLDDYFYSLSDEDFENRYTLHSIVLGVGFLSSLPLYMIHLTSVLYTCIFI